MNDEGEAEKTNNQQRIVIIGGGEEKYQREEREQTISSRTQVRKRNWGIFSSAVGRDTCEQLLDCYGRLPSSTVDVVEYGMYMPFVSICDWDGDCDQRDVDMRLFPEESVEEPWESVVFDHWPGIGSSLFPRDTRAASPWDMFIHRSCSTDRDRERAMIGKEEIF